MKMHVACGPVPSAIEPFETVSAGTSTATLERPARIKRSKRTDRAFLALFRHLLDTIEYQENGIRKNVDSEYLHNFRLALRRTRTLLGQANKTLPANRIKIFAREFRWLSDATSTARDIDVHLLHFDELKKRLPKAHHADLEPLHEYLNRCQGAEYQSLLKTLNSAHYRQLKRSWRAFLTVRPRPFRKRPNAMRAVGDVAPIYIAEVFDKAAKQGRRLQVDADDTAFHELRKTCKKLRYLLEYFKDVIPKVRVKKIIRELRDLQERLGDYQDLLIQNEFLARYRADAAVSQTDAVPVNQALSLLIAALADDEYRLKKDCIIAWRQFADYADRKSFRKLIQSSGRSNSKKRRRNN